jgi:hypothetical protein
VIQRREHFLAPMLAHQAVRRKSHSLPGSGEGLAHVRQALYRKVTLFFLFLCGEAPATFPGRTPAPMCACQLLLRALTSMGLVAFLSLSGVARDRFIWLAEYASGAVALLRHSFSAKV